MKFCREDRHLVKVPCMFHIKRTQIERGYALLDTKSATTFILDKTSKALGLEGKPVKPMLSTMYAENKAADSCKTSCAWFQQ